MLYSLCNQAVKYQKQNVPALLPTFVMGNRDMDEAKHLPDLTGRKLL